MKSPSAIFSFFSISVFLLLTACTSSSNDNNLAGSISRTASLGTSVENIQLTTGVQSEIKFTFTVPGDISAKGDATINLTRTLQHISLSTNMVDNSSTFETIRLLAYALVKEAFATTHATTMVTAYFSFPGDPNVCSSLYMVGPVDLAGAIGQELTSTTDTIAMDQTTIDIVNTGSFEMCIVTIPPIDAFLNVTDVEVDFALCEPPASNYVGDWAGTFTCTNFNVMNDPPTAINLTISDNGDGSFHYDDGTAAYDGHICGTKFKFNGSAPGDYTESGTLQFTSATTATKSSVWNSIPPGGSGGNCSDTLSKI